MAILNSIPVHDGSLFEWEGQEGLTDLSVLTQERPNTRMMDRIFDDACDMGFYVKSHRTGASQLFVREQTHLEPGYSDIINRWTFVSHPVSKGFRLTVFND